MMYFLVFCLFLPQLSNSASIQGQRYKKNVFQPIRDGVWSEWSKWTSCSRSCGGGISSRSRSCFPPSTMSFRGRGLEPVDEERCRGQGNDQILCNLHRCPFSSISFRSQQCAKFNHIPYQGKYYSWESAENDRPLCALDCKTKERSDISTRMADMVVDGTRCRDDSLDVCISGICTKVGCDLKLDSNKKVDACGVCDGNGTACSDHHAVFIWEETPLSHCSVPCGGGFMMARPICINAKTREHVIDDLCDSTNRPNERMAPCNQKACPARWEVDDWKSCSKPCGRGVKERNVSCIIDENGEKVKT
uniref:ADAMTS/ADAMTS-like cysteine-rich domain-containing protein n=1 Tax=Lepeophtheirus salmonis TaxID=72036 RepID=A0A0K2UCB0_LEPSM